MDRYRIFGSVRFGGYLSPGGVALRRCIHTTTRPLSLPWVAMMTEQCSHAPVAGDRLSPDLCPRLDDQGFPAWWVFPRQARPSPSLIVRGKLTRRADDWIILVTWVSFVLSATWIVHPVA